MLWLIHTFSVLPLQLKKLRRHKSTIDLSNANPARGHKEVRRSTGHIMVTTRCLNQKGSRSRQKPSQVQPTENTGNISASRRFLWVRSTVSTAVSGVLPVFQNLKKKQAINSEDCPMCCPFKKVIKSDTQSFLALLEDKLCDILQAMAPTNVETVHQTSMFHIESNPERRARTVVTYPRQTFSATKRTNRATFSFDQQAQNSQGHISYRNEEN